MDLPDIKAKVRVDTSGIAVAEGEVKAFSESVKSSLDERTGAGSAFVKFAENGELASTRITSSTAKTRADLDALQARVKTWAADAGKDFEAGTQAIVKLGEDGTASLGKLTQSLVGVAPPAEAVVADFAGIGSAGPYAIAAIVTLGVMAATAVAPIAGLAGGLAAVLALGGGIIGAFGAMAVGAGILAARSEGWAAAGANLVTAQANLKTAQDAYNVSIHGAETPLQKLHDAQVALAAAQKAADNPLTNLETHLSNYANTLGQQAAPATGMLLDWLSKLSDKIEPVATQLLSWFGERLPKVLPIVSTLLGDVGTALEGFGKRLGPIVDDWIKHPEHFETAFKQVVDKVVQVTGDVIDKAQELATWWSEHHVTLERDASIVFGTIGSLAGEAQFIIGTLINAFDLMVLQFKITQTAVESAAGAIGEAISGIGSAARGVESDIGRLILAISRLPGAGALTSIGANLIQLPGGEGGRASGGSVVPGGVYRVGEEGPETLFMGSSGGYVVPNSGGAASGAGMGQTERLLAMQNDRLDQQTGLLAAISGKLDAPLFSNRAYGS